MTSGRRSKRWWVPGSNIRLSGIVVMGSISDSGGVPRPTDRVAASIEIGDVLGERPCEQFGSAMRPPRTQLIDIFTQLFDYLERRAFEELTQKLRRSGSGSGECEILSDQQEKQQGLLAGKIGCLKNHDDFVQSDRPSPAQRAAQAVTLDSGDPRNLGVRFATFLDGALDQTRDA
jgi:hypothetical protein